MPSIKPMPGFIVVRELPVTHYLNFESDKAIPTTRGEVIAANGCYEELIPGTVVHFQGGVKHSELGIDYRIVPQGKVLFYE